MAFSTNAMGWDDLFDASGNETDSEFTTNERVSKKSAKTDEDINKDLIDESFDELTKIKYIGKSGSSSQKLFILDNLPKFVSKYNNIIWDEIFAKVLEPINQETNFYKIKVGRGIAFALQTNPELKPTPNIANLIYAVAKKMSEMRDEDISAAWKASLLEIFPYLSSDICKAYFTELVNENAVKLSVTSRLWIAQAMGPLSISLDEDTFKNVLLKKIKVFAQDIDSEVRLCMCHSLKTIAENAKPSTRTEILEECLELIVDDEQSVRQAAFEKLVEVLHLFDRDQIQNKVYPQIKDLIAQKKPGDAAHICKGIGKIIWEWKEKLLKDQLESLLTSYLIFAQSQEVLVRQSIAFNLPSIVATFGRSQFKLLRINEVTEKLAKDPAPEVRKIVASGLHEIAKLLQEDARLYLREFYLQFLADDATDVCISLVYNLSALNAALVLPPEMQDEEKRGLIPKIMALERKIAAKQGYWRDHQILLGQLKSVQSYIGQEHTFNLFAPMFIQVLKESRMIPVKDEAIEVLCHYLRYFSKVEYKDHIIKKIYEFKKSTNHQHRLLYLKVCERVLSTFSRRYFKEYFINEYLDMPKDTVSNIRLKFVTMVPRVRGTLSIPKDITLLHRLTDIIGTLMTNESSSDIVQHAKYCLKYMKVESGLEKDDKEDRALEEEEDKILTYSPSRGAPALAANSTSYERDYDSSKTSSTTNKPGTSATSNALGSSNRASLVKDSPAIKKPAASTSTTSSGSSNSSSTAPTSSSSTSASSSSTAAAAAPAPANGRTISALPATQSNAKSVNSSSSLMDEKKKQISTPLSRISGLSSSVTTSSTSSSSTVPTSTTKLMTGASGIGAKPSPTIGGPKPTAASSTTSMTAKAPTTSMTKPPGAGLASSNAAPVTKMTPSTPSKTGPSTAPTASPANKKPTINTR